MSEQNPYEQLGVTEDASFEEIQEAKQRLLQQYQSDSKVVESIEMAYDAVIMDRLRMRQEGKIKVPDRIRFPERVTTPPAQKKTIAVNKSPDWLKGTLDTPSTGEMGLGAIIYGSLGGITLLVPDPNGSLLPLLLALGVFVSIYLLNRKEKRFGRAVLLTFIGLVSGVLLGVGLASLNLGLPIGDRQLYAVLTFFLFWSIGSFLR